MKVYHGTTMIVDAPLAGIGRQNLDFGLGFYVTDIEEQAISWATRPVNGGKPNILNKYELDIENILSAGFRCKKFGAYDSEWLDFVVGNRRGGTSWKEYDIVEGGIANDRVFNTIELFDVRLITKDETLERLKYEKPNNQICIIAQQILDDYLHFVEAIDLRKEVEHG
jgi:hypothetical protein